MKFIAVWSLKEEVDQEDLAEVIGRRATGEFPEGLELIAEYWSTQGSPAVFSIFETDDPAALMINSVAWMDALNVEVFPVVTWEEGMEALGRHFGEE